MLSQAPHTVFGSKDKIIEGWYWAIPASEVPVKGVRPLKFLDHDLVIFRGVSGKLNVLDAYCPHMGAHLAEGRVEGEEIRCLFHYWKFNGEGQCTDIPCLPKPLKVAVKHWANEEKYGLVWLWVGDGQPNQPVPFVPELKDVETDALVANSFVKNCHPHVVMINAIDVQHFASVHNLPVKLELIPNDIEGGKAIVFANSTPIPKEKWWLRTLGRFYDNALTYNLSYWNGSNGTVTIGPDFLHFHIMFALRPTVDGKAEGHTLVITKRRPALMGKIVNRLLLSVTYILGRYFARGDTKIFQTIRFELKHPIAQDAAIMRFVQHVDRLPHVAWGFRQPKLGEGI